jgi:hypothetical protein
VVFWVSLFDAWEFGWFFGIGAFYVRLVSNEEKNSVTKNGAG